MKNDFEDVRCLVCDNYYDGLSSGLDVGVCPSCHEHARLGKRVIEVEQSTDCWCNHQGLCWVCKTQEMFEEMKIKKP